MFNFFKKGKQSATETAPAEETSLAKVEFYSMPEKFRNAGLGGGAPTKKAGLIIVAGGGGLLVVALAALGWYIYQTGGSKQLSQPANEATTQQTATPADNNQLVATVGTPEQTAITAEDDSTVKDCGQSLDFTAASSDYESDSALVCLGERVNADCKQATLNLNAAEANSVKLSILGLRQDKCLVQVDYPDIASINAEKIKPYADTSLQCFYSASDLNNLNYQPGQLAAYLYQQSSVASLTNDTACSGTAVERWRAQSSLAEETPPVTAGADTDGDGLTDMEETAVFNSNSNNQDSDGDSYADGSEVSNLYNPAGAGTLADSGLFAEYANSKYSYSVLYPKAWQLQDTLGGDSVFFFSGVDGSVQLLAQDNLEKEDIKSWYAKLVSTSVADVTQTVFTTKNNLELIYSPDGLTAYATAAGGGSKVFVLTYSPEESGTIQFKATFEMMINSFKLK